MLQSTRATLRVVRASASSRVSSAKYWPVLTKCHVLIELRSFSSSVSRLTTPVEQPVAWPDVRETVRPSAMWLVPEGSKFDQQQVLEELPVLGDHGDELPVVLLLVTPKLAHLFENDHPFLSSLVNTIYGKAAEGALRQSIVAVVDALPVLGRLRGDRKPEIHGTEGIAICISPGFDVQPATNKESLQPLISMTARHPFFDGERYITPSWSGGVANTTFINGRQHTLFMQNWLNRERQQWVPEMKRQILSRVDIQTYPNRTGNFLSVVWYSKMFKLTDPKVILSSMGNIVRQVQTSDGQQLAASHELEAIVPDMLKKLQTTTPTGDLRVFALVYPPGLGAKDLFKDCVWKNTSKDTHIHMRKNSINLLDLLIKGARLYRVTSGGAGWGKKAGLLSLEPVTELGGSVIEPEFPSFIFEQTQDIRMPGSADLFPPGHVIQFLGTFHDTQGSKKDAISIKEAKRTTKESATSLADWMNGEKAQQFCLGNTILPETHQYTSLEDIESSFTNQNARNDSLPRSLIFRLHQFGFLTTSALGLSARYHSPSQHIQAQMQFWPPTLGSPDIDTGYKHSSLIELPNSYFLAKFAAAAKVTDEAANSYIGSESSEEPESSLNPVTLTGESSETASVTLASQRLRVAESSQKDSYLRKRQRLVREMGDEREGVIQKVTAELSPVQKYRRQSGHEAIIRVETMREDVSLSSRETLQKLFMSKLYAPRHLRQLRRSLKHRSTRLLNGQSVNLRVHADAVWRRVESTSEAREASTVDPPLFRYTASKFPEELSEIFTNESSGSEDLRVAVDEDREYPMRLMEANPHDSVEFNPFRGIPEPEPDPKSPVRRTVSVLSTRKHDLSSLIQESTVFSTYRKADARQDEAEAKIKSENDRKAVESLTTDL